MKLSQLRYFGPAAKTAVAEKAKAVGIEKETWYLADDYGFVKCDPCRVFIRGVFLHKARIADDMSLIDAQPWPGKDEKGYVKNVPGYQDRAVVLCLVNPGNNVLVPALATPNRALCRPFINAAEKLEGDLADATVRDGITKRPGYDIVAGFPPSGILVWTLKGETGETKSKAKYNVGVGVFGPPTLEEAVAFKEGDWTAADQAYAAAVEEVTAKFI